MTDAAKAESYPLMEIPDFFIIGAPKCGTTALCSYLRAHPNVFMSRIKEPHYFSRDLPGRRDVDDEDEYLSLFVGAPGGAMVGEGSASYLFSKTAIQEIIERNPRAQMIAILRNPIDMAQAFHAERLYNLNEDVADFETAWNLQGERQNGRSIPAYCREPKLLQYREICNFAAQIRRFFELVPVSQRLVCIFEEFARKPRDTYAAILEFLGLPDDGRSEFPRVNANKALRSRRLAEWHRSAKPRLGRWYGPLKTVANAIGLHPSHVIRGWNVESRPRAALNDQFRRQLVDQFATDVRQLEQLLGRTLDCWDDFKLRKQ